MQLCYQSSTTIRLVTFKTLALSLLRHFADKVKMSTTSKGHNSVKFTWTYLKIQSGNLHIVSNTLNFKTLAEIRFEISC